ncbi:MAG: HDIG domain-containing protein [Proteobacteria bacterium]|nr:HDIG domain-containing protein [Pseudomonadota bacterium]MBU1639535.1 HDIG domain-containing protein [Pseudomonadota bacterium]
MQTILEQIDKQSQIMGRQIYVVGGAVRDLLLGRSSPDVDLAIDRDALAFGDHLAGVLSGRFIILDGDEGVGRLVCHGHVVDIAVFKDSSVTIEEDLARRDFTINAMAIALGDWLAHKQGAAIIDPCGGKTDLQGQLIRLVSQNALLDDPLRILRGYRLQALTGFALDQDFITRAVAHRNLLALPAAERISTELHLIFESSRASEVVGAMAAAGILAQVCPELMSGSGVEQPASHHLDVFEHNLAALRAMDDIIRQPGKYFPDSSPVITAYLQETKRRRQLRWAALFHDLGKPHTQVVQEGRITFYQHDMVGARLFTKMAKRLRFTKSDIKKISLLISQHMRPFHLCNILRQGPVSAKACLRLAKSVGEDLPGLFLLAMADSLAGQGETKPEEMEKEIAILFGQVQQQMDLYIAPLLAGPPLLTGHDLVSAGFPPGPVFKEILEGLQQAQVAGEVVDRAAAFTWLDGYKS